MVYNRKTVIRMSMMIFGLVCMLVLILFLCKKSNQSCELLYLSFNKEEGVLHYQYEKPLYASAKTPSWRPGIDGSALLFDGSATYIEHTPEEICVRGNCFSVCVWLAPRAFEWDAPDAADIGEEHLTAVLSQYNKQNKQGVLLGFQRFGRPCFQVGTGDAWFTLWAKEERLEKYQWNQLAASFDGNAGEMKLFLNGKEIASKIIKKGSSIKAAENENLLIGKNSHAEKMAAGSLNMFSGLMDEMHLYKKVMSENQLMYSEPPEIKYEDIQLENLLTDDIYKTQYHGGPYQHWMNEPHAPFFYKGKYHLFFQSNSIGTYWRNICWGHLVSDDLVNWKPVKNAIEPLENSVVPDGVWSGGATLDKNGIPLLFFTAGNDSFAKEGLISNQNIGLAYPADLTDPALTDWIIYDKLAVQQMPGQGRSGEFRDPHIWKDGGKWNMLVCSGSTSSDGGTALLFQTERLEVLPDGKIDMNWIYRGPVYEMENQSVTYGNTWELPILLPVENKTGSLRKYLFIFSPAPASLADNKIYYFTGDFDCDSGRFIPDEKYCGLPSVLDYGNNVFTGPSAFINPLDNKICLFSIMQDQRGGAEEGAAGWAHCVGLTRNIYLNEAGNDLCVTPVKEVENLKGECILDLSEVSLEEANNQLKNVRGDMLLIQAKIVLKENSRFGIRVKSNGKRDETFFEYDAEKEEVSAQTRNKGKAATLNRVFGNLKNPDKLLKIEMFIDRSLIEAFFNETKSISLRSYSAYDSQDISLYGAEDSLNESVIRELKIYRMKSIYE